MNEYLIIKKITDIDEDDLNIMTTWMYNWWGKREHYSFEEVKCFMLHSMQENRLPITYGMFLDNKIIGMYQFTYEDLSIRPDIYPWLANVYIDKDYRGKGYGRKLLESIKTTFQDITDFNEIYLYTQSTLDCMKNLAGYLLVILTLILRILECKDFISLQ